MRVRFLEDTIFETEGFRKGPRFEAGSVHEFSDDAAERWIRRGLAEKVESTRRLPRAAVEPPQQLPADHSAPPVDPAPPSSAPAS
jgi:hypothetical protein